MENKNESMIPEAQKNYGEPEISAVHYNEDVVCSSSDPWETERV